MYRGPWTKSTTGQDATVISHEQAAPKMVAGIVLKGRFVCILAASFCWDSRLESNLIA